ncbi:MAG: NosD domain-containing protein [Halobacteriota archaeon]
METNKIAVGITVLVVLAALLALAVSGSTYDHDQAYNANAVYFVPEDSVVPGCCNETLIGIWTNTNGSIASGTMLFNYDQYCANVTKFVFNSTNWEPGSSNAELTEGQVSIRFITFTPGGRGPGPVHLGDLTVQCCSRSRCIINLTWDTAHSYLEDDLGDEIVSVNWARGTFSCVPLEPPNMISFSPSSLVTDVEGVTRSFTITMDQTVNISWQINGTEVKYNRGVTEAFYTNRSANIGTWNVSAIACNENGRVVQTWIWNVRAGVIGAKTIYVDDDFTDDPANHRWDTIQEGITDADDGDTVLVYNGTYTENVDLNKQLTLIGEEMPKIDAHGSGDAIKTTADNCTVKGFCCVNAQPSPYAGIHVKSNNNVIVENTCKDNYKGIYLRGSLNEIRNNIAIYNNKSGITLSGSDNNRIIGNGASNSVNHRGISLYFSNNNEIQNNIANYNHDDGIGLSTSSENIIVNNTAKDNGNDGIHLFESSNNEIQNNIVNYNHDDGIRLSRSSENIIVNNTAKDNVDDGIVLSDSSNNNIYLNNFIANIYNAYSYNSSNIWHSTSEITYTYNSQSHTNFMGNYWSDYKGSDTDGDGIGGSSYSIDGDADFYPLMKPWEKYFALQVNWPPHNPTLIPDKPEPQPAGTAITWSASATEPDGDTLYYRFWIKGPSTGDLWTIIQDWSTDNTLSWHTTTADIGDTDIAVWIRDGHHEPTNSHDLEMVISNYQIISGTCKVQITSDPSDTDRPSIVYANGYYYVAYQSIEKSHGIYIKKFDSLWKFKKKVEVVSGSAYYDSPSLAFANNKLYVAYISNAEGANKNDYDVIVKEYNPNSFACTSGEKYLTTLQSCQDLPALYYKDGYFYLAYQSWETGNGDIYIKKFDSNWDQLKKVRVTSKSSLQDRPSITYADGYFYVAYFSEETGYYDIFVKRLGPNLNLDSWKKQITSKSSYQSYPSITFVNNQFTIAYASTETGTLGIYMKTYDNNWNYIGKTKVIDDNSAHERRPSITYAQNDLWIAYVHNLIDGNWNIFAIIPGCE